MNSELPPGKRLAAMEISLSGLFDLSPDFTGYIRAVADNGEGFLLVEQGSAVAGGFSAGDLNLCGEDVYRQMMNKDSLECVLSTYTPDEIGAAKTEIMEDFGIFLDEKEKEVSGESILSAETLRAVMRQPGVRAVSVFYEGFALQSVGDADFEHVAAVAEDLVRAGAKITGDLMMGALDQLLLETPEGKLIVAPAADDLFICVLAETTANLGLIRLALQGIKYDMSEEEKTD